MTTIWTPWQTFEQITRDIDWDARSLQGVPLSDDELKKLFDLKIECDNRKRDYPGMFYNPYFSKRKPDWRPQLDFHMSQARIKQAIAGNRAGKTVCGAKELEWAASGEHPWIKFPVPGEYWVVSLTNQMSIEVAEAELRKWVSRRAIKRWDAKYRVMTLMNDTTIGFKSCEQEINTFGGTAKDGIWFDEEPPGEHGYQIYKECRMRTIDRNGRIWFTMTPVLGMSWTADEIYEPAIAGNPNYFVVEFSTYDNPHLTEDVIKEIEKDCTEDERDMRFYGKYVQFAGLVYKEFDRDVHIVQPFEIPAHWKRYRSIDHGINNPTACGWYAVNPDDEIFLYDEYYQTDRTAFENAEAIVSMTGADKIQWTTIDPSTANRDPVARVSVRDEYRRAGIVTRLATNDVMPGINAVKQLLKVNESTKRPKIYFFSTCYNHIKEIQRYKWQKIRNSVDKNSSEAPQKIMDHCMDELRYLVMSKPRYKIEDDTDERESVPWYK
jgi:phage terminase large subunit-like protein